MRCGRGRIAGPSSSACANGRAAGARQHPIAVYFADTRVNLYQIRQWYAPLAELAKRHPVAIITRSPGASLTLIDESPVPVVYRRRITDLEQFVDEQDLRIVFYVNQNQKNFQMFRYGRMWHVFINHGESDKMYMTTNQFKAYDYALVAGDAALDRLSRKLWDFDLGKKAIPIGRPQADHFAGDAAVHRRTTAPSCSTPRPGRATGPRPPTARSRATASRSPRRCSRRRAHRLIYRPHPRSGVIDPEYRDANARIIAAIAAANQRDPARAARLRRRARPGLAARRRRRRDHRHLGDDLRPARDGQADHRGASGEPGCRGRRRGIPGLGRVARRRSRRRRARARRPGAERRRGARRARRTGRSGTSATRRPGAATKRFHAAVERAAGGVGPAREDPRRRQAPRANPTRSTKRTTKRACRRTRTSRARRAAGHRRRSGAGGGSRAAGRALRPGRRRRGSRGARRRGALGARGAFGGLGTASRVSGNATGAGPNASCDDRTMLRPIRWLPPPPIDGADAERDEPADDRGPLGDREPADERVADAGRDLAECGARQARGEQLAPVGAAGAALSGGLAGELAR